MPAFRPSFRVARALELPHSYAPRPTLRPSTIRRGAIRTPRRCMSDVPPNKKPDPLEEWRNPPPSKWPNRIRLAMLPFIGAIIYSMVRNKLYEPLNLIPKASTVDRRLHSHRGPDNRPERRAPQAREWRLRTIPYAPTHGAIHKAAPKADRR
jgi:hypothetical protein